MKLKTAFQIKALFSYDIIQYLLLHTNVTVWAVQTYTIAFAIKPIEIAGIFQIVNWALANFFSPLFSKAWRDALCSYVIVLTYLIGDLLQWTWIWGIQRTWAAT